MATAYLHAADAFEFEAFGGGRGEVPGPARDVGTAVDHRSDQRVAVPDELDRGAAGKRLVGDADRGRAQNLATGRRAPPHTDAAVPAGAGEAVRGEGQFGFVEGARRGRRRFFGFSGDRRGKLAAPPVAAWAPETNGKEEDREGAREQGRTQPQGGPAEAGGASVKSFFRTRRWGVAVHVLRRLRG